MFYHFMTCFYPLNLSLGISSHVGRVTICNALSNYLIILLDDMVYVYILYGF